MNINRFVIHELQKEQNSVPTLILSEMLPEVTPHATNLLLQLNDKYKTRETYGRFSEEEQHPFPEHFNTYCSQVMTDNTFLEFSRQAMTVLNQQLVNTNAKGGYFLFADYTTPYGSYLSIFLVRNAEGFLFQREQQQMYDVAPQQHIGIEKLAMACKINIAKYNDAADDSNYLSFIRTDRQNTAGYFINWISATQLKKNSDYTDKLVDIIKRVDLPLALEGYGEVNRDALQKAVHDFCTNRPNGTINLVELGTQLYGEEGSNRIIDYAEQNNISIDVEFTPDKTKLRRLYKVKVSARDISLQFDQSSYNDTVRINPDQPNTIIIESEDLARQIRSEMDFANQ